MAICPVNKKIHVRHLLLFSFNQNEKPSKAARDICAVYGNGFITNRMAQKWFARFNKGNFDLADSPRSGRPVQFDDDRFHVLIEEEPRRTTRELAEKIGSSHVTVARHLHAMKKNRKELDSSFDSQKKKTSDDENIWDGVQIKRK